MTSQTTISAWLDEFARCVRERDVTGARALFAPGVRAFGTFVEYAEGREELVTRQWNDVWPRTQGFRFLDAPMVIEASEDGSLVCVLSLWESEGLDASGGSFVRRGRSTTILRRLASAPAHYVAVHTHFSKTPDGTL